MNVIPLIPKSPMTLKDYAEAFLISKARSLGSGSSRTIRAYRSDLTRFLSVHGDRLPYQVSPVDIERHLVGLSRPDGTRVAPTTANRHLATLASFFTWLVDQGTLETNPVARVKKARVRALEPAALPDDVRDQLLTQARKAGAREHALLALLLGTGMRIAEALALNVGDVQLESMAIAIKAGKGNKPRKVFFTHETRQILKRYLRTRGAAGPYTPLFTSSRGGRLSYQRAASLFKAIAGPLRNPDGSLLHLHQLRHTFCTEQLAKGMNPSLLMTLTGHSDPRTLARYTLAAQEQAAEQEFRRNNP